MGDRRELRNSLLLGLLMTLFSLALHFAPVWVTMLYRGAQTWDGAPRPHDFLVDCIEEHSGKGEPAFERRPLTTWSIEALERIGVPPAAGFIIIGFTFFLLAGLLAHHLARSFGSTPKQALIAQLLFHASPTVLFAWFDPMYTYDEPIQYVALLISLIAVLRKQNALFIVAFTISLIARETSAILLPGFAYLLGYPRRKDIVMLMAPLVLFAAFLFFYLPYVHEELSTLADIITRYRFIAFNFRDAAMSSESLCYLVMTLVLPTFLFHRFNQSKTCTEEDRRLMKAFWVTLLLNTLAVLIAAKAREARLFALPMILGWPLLGKALMAEIERLGGWVQLLSFLRKPLLAIEFAAKAVIILLGVRMLFVLSTGIQQDNLFHEYLVAELLFILACMLASTNIGRSVRPAR